MTWKSTSMIGIALFVAALLVFVHFSGGIKKSSPLTGVNIAGADFGDEKLPGVFGRDYFYPEPSSVAYYANKHVNIIRLPVLWERVQHHLGDNLDEEELRHIDATINDVTSKGMKLIIDIHNYAKYFGAAIGTPSVPPTAFGDLWRQIALRYKDNDLVVFGLMNEPTQLRTEVWLDAANDAIAKIRQAGANNLILVPGNGWSSARDWTSAKYGTPNSKVMLDVFDSADNFAFDVHQYFDRDFTGTHADCQSAEIGVTSLTDFTRWARGHGKRGFLGEFGAGSSQTCLDALDRILKFMAANGDVWIGWTYWAGGSKWPQNYFTSIEPLNGKDRPQMTLLEKYFDGAQVR
jgi:endoglucanase